MYVQQWASARAVSSIYRNFGRRKEKFSSADNVPLALKTEKKVYCISQNTSVYLV